MRHIESRLDGPLVGWSRWARHKPPAEPLRALLQMIPLMQVEVVNAAPDCLLWKKNSVGITAKVPGLYRLAIAFFLAQVRCMPSKCISHSRYPNFSPPHM